MVDQFYIARFHSHLTLSVTASITLWPVIRLEATQPYTLLWSRAEALKISLLVDSLPPWAAGSWTRLVPDMRRLFLVQVISAGGLLEEQLQTKLTWSPTLAVSGLTMMETDSGGTGRG